MHLQRSGRPRPWIVGRAMAAARALACLCVLSVAAAPAAHAQAAPDARTLAAQVQAFYDQTTTVQADFFQTYYHKLYDRYDRSRGTVTFKKPGKMRWDYAQPNGKIIVSDGQRLLVYEPGDHGGPGQLFEQPMNQQQLPAAFSFLTGAGRLENDFTFRLLDPRRQGFSGGYVLELRPRQPTPQYDRILFYVRMVGQGGRQAGIVQRVLIVDSSGNRNRFDFHGLRFNRNVPDSRFHFEPPAGTRRVRP